MIRTLGVYIHVPFCKQKCVYCDFYSLPHREDRMDAYVSTLERQIEQFSQAAAGYKVTSVYFGGGTPSYLGADRLCRLLRKVYAAFHVAYIAEITLEANPDSAQDPEALSALRRAGFNRISLGMQSADDGELRAIGRVHTMDQVRSSVEAARKAGFDNLSLDLIYGLPGQDLSRWRENLAAAVELGPEHLSCYGLKAEPGTPLYARRDALPGDEVQADMYLETVDFLEGRGYRQYEISNFARPGRESRHNLRYWTQKAYLGFGPGAHSDFQGRRFAWKRDLDAWFSGFPEYSECQILSRRERQEEYLMLRFRLAQGLHPDCFEGLFGLDFTPFLPFLERCREAGYAVCRDGAWRLTPRGFLVSNQIIGELLDIFSRISSPD
nr:radical SAM family heme chaperone HemW [uncultured Oscillibacter sp.]